jgi:hypothetical protein
VAVKTSALFWMVSCVLAGQALAQRPSRGPEPAATEGRLSLPDLNIGQSYPKDFGVMVSIVNLGGTVAPPSQATLSVYDAAGTTLWTEDQAVKSLTPRDSVQVVFTAGRRPWAGHRFRVVVDAANAVKEVSDANNSTAMLDAPGASGRETVTSSAPPAPPKTAASPTVDLAAINVFLANDGINGVVRNVGKQAYAGDRQATILLARKKDGKLVEQKLGSQKISSLAAGAQQFVSVPKPAGFDQGEGYRLTLVLTRGDGNSANDTKVHPSPDFSDSGSATVDLEAIDVLRLVEGGIARVKGTVRNVGSEPFAGQREVRIYFVDQSGDEPKTTLIASKTLKALVNGEDWEITGRLPDSLRKVQRFLLKLTVSPGDDNDANDQKTRPFGNL